VIFENINPYYLLLRDEALKSLRMNEQFKVF